MLAQGLRRTRPLRAHNARLLRKSTVQMRSPYLQWTARLALLRRPNIGLGAIGVCGQQPLGVPFASLPAARP